MALVALGGASVRVHGLDLALNRAPVGVDDPVARQLQVDHVAFVEVDDLVVSSSYQVSLCCR
jgi:hypothetical protein